MWPCWPLRTGCWCLFGKNPLPPEFLSRGCGPAGGWLLCLPAALWEKLLFNGSLSAAAPWSAVRLPVCPRHLTSALSEPWRPRACAHTPVRPLGPEQPAALSFAQPTGLGVAGSPPSYLGPNMESWWPPGQLLLGSQIIPEECDACHMLGLNQAHCHVCSILCQSQSHDQTQLKRTEDSSCLEVMVGSTLAEP